jgi:hypothetical protein
LIQNRAQADNIDSKTHSPRFDYFKFEFHSICSVTFATISANKRHLHRSNSISTFARRSNDFGGCERRRMPILCGLLLLMLELCASDRF